MSNMRGIKIMDKKWCENCRTKFMCANKFGDKYCRWQRNPRLWLSILPEEPGWYWYRKEKVKTEVIELRFVEDDHRLVADDCINRHIELWGGEFQGPIRPEGE